MHSPSAPDATAMAVTDGVVAWIGQDRPGRALYPDAEEIALDGAFVAPGFVDAHVHATATGLHLAGPDLADVTDAGQLLAVLAAAAARVDPGAVLLAHGWDESTWTSSRLPSRHEIDAAVGSVPVYASRIDVHSALVSSAAVELAPHAVDAAGWSPAGPLTGSAHHHLRRAARGAVGPAQRRAAQRQFLAAAASAGIVAVHECAGPDISGAPDLASLRDVAAATAGPEVVAYWGEHVADAESAKRSATERDVGGLAGDLFADGALGSGTAALTVPYTDSPGSCGTAYLDEHQVAEHVVACTAAGVQAGFHVIGDAATAAVVAGFARAERTVGRRALAAGRHRLEHLEMVDEAQAQQLAGWNVAASVQPQFDALWGGRTGMYATRLGADRAAAMNPFGMLAAAGVLLAGGSDAPVTPLDPWASVRAMVEHRTPGAGISPRAALNAHTKGGHRAAGVTDGTTGTLVPGAPAHFAVWEVGELVVATPDSRVQRWSTDPRSGVPPLPELTGDAELPRCLRTVRAGVPIYEAG